MYQYATLIFITTIIVHLHCLLPCKAEILQTICKKSIGTYYIPAKCSVLPLGEGRTSELECARICSRLEGCKAFNSTIQKRSEVGTCILNSTQENNLFICLQQNKVLKNSESTTLEPTKSESTTLESTKSESTTLESTKSESTTLESTTTASTTSESSTAMFAKTKKFKLIEQRVRSLTEAKTACEDIEMVLAEPESVEEVSELHKMINETEYCKYSETSSKRRGYYIGLQNPKEKVVHYSNGSLVRYETSTFWYGKQPDQNVEKDISIQCYKARSGLDGWGDRKARLQDSFHLDAACGMKKSP